MKKRNTLASIAMGVALALPSVSLNAEPYLNLGFFPEVPLYSSVLGDSDELNTGIRIPQGSEKEMLDKPIKELLPYISLSKEIPVLSLDIRSNTVPDFIPLEKRAEVRSNALETGIYPSDKLFSASLIASGRLKFPENKKPEYVGRLELFVGSPMIDDFLSDGNKLLLNAGVNSNGSLNFQEAGNKSVYSLLEAFNEESRNFFGEVYVVVKSPYSDQTAIVKCGLDNLFDSQKKIANFNLSTALELPPIFPDQGILGISKIIPYISAGIKMPLDSQWDKEFGEIGLKLTGPSKKAIMGYLHTELETNKGFSTSSGLKFDL